MIAGLSLWAGTAQGAEPPQAPQPPPAAQPVPAGTFKDEKEQASYGVGMWFGNQIKRSGMEVDVETIGQGIKDVLAGAKTKMTEQQAQEFLQTYQREARRKMMENNKKQAAAFLEENKNKPGVKVIPVELSETNKAELQYKVITEGTGAIPKSNDTVKVNYRGTLINGKEFDSSAKQGRPATFMVNRVIKGWTVALEHMKVGSKWELFVPPALGYGDMGSGTIEPGSALIFEVELVSIEPPQPAPTPQPLTSDIIKVPSAEELKKGAKIEVIKPEDAARQAQEAQKKNEKK